ncbi:hypothetical protein L226DRAFT_615590 [Lentinus tigrinus ALCF2SS1-7]|uniref:F-box domain-containing protein n=1 Tax=Lentinus tigrinus ALCF2SS1-6 TaxID=1328759 RepID=A0A5C2RX45_9APHY|nr:hypothetical protein L227DRAFT_308382 [Lentinus tigrinus ALCF2SS1-6]RPD71309.1 hypothetical protein L226DRAFT_615590 [Lentinus tigrinus ALCF2SS1-7]
MTQNREPTPEQIRAHFAGLPPAHSAELADLIEEDCRARIEEYLLKIEELHECFRGVRSMRNAAATINFKLPPEVIMHVFRCVQPDTRRSIALTHVCRLWRSLVDAVPEFWVRLLDPRVSEVVEMTGDEAWHCQLVTDMMRKSSPRAFGTALMSRELPAVDKERTADCFSRLSSLSLMYSEGDRLEALRFTSFPCLDTLSLWREVAHPQEALPFTSMRSSQFPRLHTLHTNCQSLASCFAYPHLRELSVGSPSILESSLDLPSQRQRFRVCCNVKDVLNTIQRCTGLEVLRFSHSLPCSQHEESGNGTIVHMPRLRVLTIVDRATRGLRLDTISYLLLTDGPCSINAFKERFELDPATLREYQKRLEAVASSVNLSSDATQIPATPEL